MEWTSTLALFSLLEADSEGIGPASVASADRAVRAGVASGSTRDRQDVGCSWRWCVRQSAVEPAGVGGNGAVAEHERRDALLALEGRVVELTKREYTSEQLAVSAKAS